MQQSDTIQDAVDRACAFMEARWLLLSSVPPRTREPLSANDLEEVMTKL